MAGGSSTRFGPKNKALHVWRGSALVDHVLGAMRLALHPEDVWVSVAHLNRSPRLVEHLHGHSGLTFVEDAIGFEGPCAGLAAGALYATRAGAEWMAVLACDMPGVRFGLLSGLAEMALDAPEHVSWIMPRRIVDGRRIVEPFHAFYRPGALYSLLSRARDQNVTRLQHIFKNASDGFFVDEPQLQEMDSGWKASVFSINSKDDLETLENLFFSF